MAKIKNELKNDNSHYFTQWGSRNVKLPFNEELDNILGAKPNIAGVSFKEEIVGNTNTMETFNDGMIPSHTRVRDMYKIGRTMSDNRGASICGVGQIESIVAGRKSAKAIGTLTVKVVYNGEYSVFTCIANGNDFSINCEYDEPKPCDGPNCIKKTFEGQKKLTEKEIEELKIIAALKIYPYSLENPNFKFYFNNELLDPFDVMYGDVNDDRLKRFKKDYNLKFHNKTISCKLHMIDCARYVKPNGFEIDEDNANDFDKFYGFSSDCTGAFVNYDNNLVMYGGAYSWGFFGDKYHSTHNGQKVMLTFGCNNDLKSEIFSESPDKKNVKFGIQDIVDYDGTKVFEEVISDINEHIEQWTKERSKVNENGEKIDTENEKKIYESILQDEKIADLLKNLYTSLSKEQFFIFSKKKMNTIFNDSGCTKNKSVQYKLNV